MFKVMALLTKRADISRADLIEHYEQHHVPLILGLAPAPVVYKRNYTVLDGDGPDIVTELGFPDRDAYRAWVAVMYEPASGVAEDEETFLDRSRTVSYVVEEFATTEP